MICVCSLFRMQMFLWNNIFFSLGFDVKDHYKDFGGDFAAYVAPVSCPLVVTSQLHSTGKLSFGGDFTACTAPVSCPLVATSPLT